MKWATFQAFDIPAGKTQDPAFLQSLNAAYEHFKKFRSEVIEAGLFVEGTLNVILLDFLAPTSAAGRDRLQSLVLDAEFCSFFQKWRMLRQLLDLYAEGLELDFEEMKGLRKDLHDVIALRNRFAHGVIFVKGTDLSVWIEYVEGTKQRKPIDEAELQSAKTQCDRVHALLWRVHGAIEKVGYVLPSPKA
jgi:hypothetical protein